MADDALTPPRRRGLAVAAGIAVALGQAPAGLVGVSFLGLVAGVMLIARAPDAGAAFRTGLVFGVAFFAVALHWIVEPFFVDIVRHGWMAPFALILMAVGMALFWAAGIGLAVRLAPASGMAIAAGLALGELARAYLFGGFPWASPAHALVGGLAGQAGAVVGPHGLNLALFGIAALAASVLSARRWTGLLVALVMAAALHIPVPGATPVAEDAPMVRLVQPNAPQHQKWDPAYTPIFFQRALMATAAPGAPEVVIWPETSVPVHLDAAGDVLRRISREAGGVPVIAGLNRFEGARLFNAAVLLDGEGRVDQVYDKHHLVPFGEYMPFGDWLAGFGIRGLAAQHGNGFSAGPGPELMTIEGLGTALPLICYEVVFPQGLRRAPARPRVLLQLTNDAWFGRFSGPYQHLAQARMRAIETGVPLVRAANTGVSAVVDARGRVVASLPLGTAGYLDARLPPMRAETLYYRIGDLPVALALVGFFALLAWRHRRNRLTIS